MLRSTLLYLSDQPQVFRFVRNNRLAKGFARRFVAGETLDDALTAVRALNARGISASLDELGESVTNEREARAVRDSYLNILDQLAGSRLDANVSVKLTALGLDVSEELCVTHMHDLLERARSYRTFVRIDMESGAYTERTLRLFEERFFPSFREHVGIVLQSYLYRTWADTERALELKCRVRLCKGAYKEPPELAFPDKKDVDENYVRVMQLLLSSGTYHGIATHDPKMIDATIDYAQKQGIGKEAFEFQMLFGIRRDLQRQLAKDGYNMRVYVPYGKHWYPYFMRRLAERPANIWFVLKNFFKG